VEILIFDEVDTGISGRIAEIVGLKLRQLGTRHQTLCITHLPQIAAFSRQHYVVTKEVRQGQTFTQIRMLHSDEEKARELAQLMGGQEISPNTVQLAQEMLKRAAGVDAA
jgi:DNA repair protein RecN (Recombination protein N)